MESKYCWKVKIAEVYCNAMIFIRQRISLFQYSSMQYISKKEISKKGICPFVLSDGKHSAELLTPRSCYKRDLGHLPGRMDK